MEAAIQRFSHTLAATYARLANGRPVPTELSDEKMLAIEDCWAALVQKTPSWGLGVQHLSQVVDKVPGMKGTYDSEALPGSMAILDMNGDGLVDYLEFKAYMVTVWSTSLELTSGSSAAPAAPEAVDNSRNARRRRRRERRGGDIVSHCPDLLLVGRRRLSEVFYMHLQVVTSEFLAAQKAGTTKGRNPFKSLPSYDPSLSLYIRTKSLTLARRIGGQVNGSELIQSVRKKLMAMEHLQAKLIEDSSAANRSSSGAGNAEDSDGDGDGDEPADEQAEARRRRQQQLLREEAAMMRKALHEAQVDPQGDGGASDASPHSDASPNRARPPSQAQPQNAGFSGMFRKLGALFGKPSEAAPPPGAARALPESPLRAPPSQTLGRRSDNSQLLPPVPSMTQRDRTPPSRSVDATGQVATQYDRHIVRYNNSDLNLRDLADSSGGYASDGGASSTGPGSSGAVQGPPRGTRPHSLSETRKTGSIGSTASSGAPGVGLRSPLRHGSGIGGERKESPSRFGPTPPSLEKESSEPTLRSRHMAGGAQTELSVLQMAVLAEAGVTLMSLSADGERNRLGSPGSKLAAEGSAAQLSLPSLQSAQTSSGRVTPRSGDLSTLPMLKSHNSASKVK